MNGWGVIYPPNRLGDFLKGIRIRALFSWGRCGPCVVCEGGLEEVLGDFYGIQYFCSWRLE